MQAINFVDTTLRDAHQSLWNGKMTTAMMLPIAKEIDNIGFESIDFMALISMDWCVRNQEENPWVRLRLMSEAMPNTPLIVGGVLRNFGNVPDSITEFWVKILAKNGAKRIRINDPCHDISEISKALKWSKNAGLKTMVALIYCYSPVHTDEYYANKAYEICKAGADILFIKDVGGLLTPDRTKSLISSIHNKTEGIPLEIHSHCTTGLAPLCYLEAIQLGVKTVHTALPPLANGASQPSMLNVLDNLSMISYHSNVNLKAIHNVIEHFTYIAKTENLPIGVPVEYDLFQYEHQVPGGMMSNFKAELKKRGLLGNLRNILEEIVVIRKELGYPIMVTPLSQYIGAQAILNYTLGERYKIVTDEIIKYVLGHYGEIVGPLDKDVHNKILNNHRTKDLEKWSPSEDTIDSIRQRYDPSISDEEFILRVISSDQKAVDNVMTNDMQLHVLPRGDKPINELIRALAMHKNANYIHLKKGNFSITLR